MYGKLINFKSLTFEVVLTEEKDEIDYSQYGILVNLFLFVFDDGMV